MVRQQTLFVTRHSITLHKLIMLTFFSVFSLTNSFGQSKPQEKNSVISSIRQMVRQINNYKNYEVVTIDDSEDFLGHGTDNGGTLKGYYKGASLKKIVEWVGLSNRVVQNEYYFNKGNLVFVYSTDKRCKANDKTGEIDCSKFEKAVKNLYYFSNGKLINAILSDKEHEKTKQQDATDFLTSSNHYLKLLYGRRQ